MLNCTKKSIPIENHEFRSPFHLKIAEQLKTNDFYFGFD
jgi:hypothetical protein